MNQNGSSRKAALHSLPLIIQERPLKEGGKKMKKEMVYCEFLERKVDKSKTCPRYTCNQCPELRPKLSARPPFYARLYIEGKISLPVPHNISDLIELSELTKKDGVLESFIKRHKTEAENEISKLKQNKLSTLEGLKLSTSLENKIYVSLYEFVQAINVSAEPTLKKENREITEQREKTIYHLEKVLELKYPFLSESTVEAIKNELVKLKNVAKDKYHPVKELELYKEIIQPSIRTGLLGGSVSYEESYKKLEKLLSPRMTVKTGRPSKFFFKALQFVVYKLLQEQARIAIEKAKTLTAEIINEYLNKEGRDKMATLTSKDIDNALHS